MTSVLVVADCPEIEALLADLVLFAGYHPVFVRADETPLATLVRRPVDAILLDATLPLTDLEALDAVAHEHVTAVVYVASTMSADELRQFAQSRAATHFPLPNGPKHLGAVLSSALHSIGKNPAAGGEPPVEIVLAVRAMAHARRLGTTVRDLRDENRSLRQDRDELLREARSSRDQLRTAILQYARGLLGDGATRERAFDLVCTAVRESAESIGVPELLLTAQSDAQGWVDEVYRVA